MPLTRRKFVTSVIGAPVFLTSIPSLALDRWQRTLVLVELNGGNDGLNTVVPYADPLYRPLRPELAVPADKVLQLDERLGLHPELERLMPLWADREMAVVLGVGYPEPNFSHFRSIDIWETATEEHRFAEEGWITRTFREGRPPASLAADGIVLGRNDPGPLTGYGSRIVNLKRLRSLKKQRQKLKTPNITRENSGLTHVIKTQDRINHAARKLVEKNLDKVALKGEFPAHSFGKQMELAARLIAGGSGIPVIKCSLGGFDTHAGQIYRHPRLMGKLAGGLSAFTQTMKAAGLWDKILVMTYAEFGRRPKENASGGTDHGTAAPHFMLGGRVRGGFYGEQPPLDQLRNENLEHRVDFREMYAAVARDWWGLKAEFLSTKALSVIV